MHRIPKKKWNKGLLVRCKPLLYLDEPAEGLTENEFYVVEDPPFEFEGQWFIGVVNDRGKLHAYCLDRFAQAKRIGETAVAEYEEIMATQEAYDSIRTGVSDDQSQGR